MKDHDALRRNHWNNHLARHAHHKPDAVMLRYLGASTTWAQQQQRSRALAAGLAVRGVGAGDRVAVVMTNRPEFIDLLFAATSLGAIVVPVNFRLTADEIAFVLVDSGAVLVAVDEIGGPPAARAMATLDTSPALYAVGEVAGAQPFGTLSIADGVPPVVDVAEDSAALIMYTSGTTGTPKGAVLSHQNLQCQAVTLIRNWRLFDDDEVTLCAAPLFHIAAVGGLAPMTLIGGTTVLMPSGNFNAADTLAVLEAERVSSAFLVPAQWQVICADSSLPERDLSALKTTCWGAAPATTTLLHRMAEVFPQVTNVAVFGQTEMSPVTCALDGRDALRKIGSIGKPVSTVSVRIVDDEMNDVPPGTVGEIVYRGPGTMVGYWNRPEATAEAFAGGWFHSGDLVREDDEGFLYVVDRKKDMIITGGENVYCAEVENALSAHPDIVELCVIGAADERWGETVVAVAVLRDGVTLDVEALRDWGSDRLARYKLPTVLHVVDALPRNASGKVTKPTLRALFAPAT